VSKKENRKRKGKISLHKKERYKKMNPQKLIIGKVKNSNQGIRKLLFTHTTTFNNQSPKPTKTCPKGIKGKQKNQDNPFLFPFPRDALLSTLFTP
jgi:hypothetical protein